MVLAVHGAQVIDGTRTDPIPDGAVVVDGGRITQVGKISALRLSAGTEILEAGGTVLPGLVNAHTHCSIIPGLGDQTGQMRQPPLVSGFRAAGNMRRELLSGVTTARVMGEEHHLDIEMRRAIDGGGLRGPRRRGCWIELPSAPGQGRAHTVDDGS